MLTLLSEAAEEHPLLCVVDSIMSFTPEQFLSSRPAGNGSGTGPGVQGVVAEQEALRRVATLVAREVSDEQLFAAVNRELGRLVRADAAAVLRFESDETVTLVAAWTAADAPVLPGEREPVNTSLRRLRDAARLLRCGASDVPLTGPFIGLIRRFGIRALVAVPVQVDARVWGACVVASQGTGPFPAATETLMAGFTVLVATAISNAESRGDSPGRSS